MQIYNPGPTSGGFPEAFQTGLQQLMQVKMNKIQQRHAGNALQKLIPGMTAQQAEAFSSQPLPVQQAFIKSGLMGAFSNQEQPGSNPTSLPKAQQPMQENFNEIAPEFGPQETMQRALSSGMNPVQQKQMMQPEINSTQQNNAAQAQPLTRKDIIKNKIQQTLNDKFATSQQKSAAIKNLISIEKEEDKNQRKEQLEADKEGKVAHKAIFKDYKAAKDNDRRLNRMEELVKKGNLTRPRWHALLNGLEHGLFGLGINLHSLENADSQEFNKLSKDFLKNAKDVFGARITDTDLIQYLKSIPDLSQSKEGKLAVIYNNKLFNEASRARFEASEVVRKQNGGHFPIDYEEQVEKLAGPKLDEIAQRFAKGVQIPKQLKEKTTLGNLVAGDPLNILFGQG
jgi:hypothetical protein